MESGRVLDIGFESRTSGTAFYSSTADRDVSENASKMRDFGRSLSMNVAQGRQRLTESLLQPGDSHTVTSSAIASESAESHAVSRRPQEMKS